MDMAVACVEASPVIKSQMSPLGAMAVAVAGGKVVAVGFGHSSELAARAAISKRSAMAPFRGDALESADDELFADEVLERLQRYAAAEAVELKDIPVSVDHLSPFQRRVVKTCRSIRPGQRRTYGELAAAAGSPGAARAVGQVMASNRVPLIVPCHRVVASGGGLGGFSAPQGLAMKRRLLAMEESFGDGGR
jgi:methylated-DNA-[protein]-cysteine S-methyltransferase